MSFDFRLFAKELPGTHGFEGVVGYGLFIGEAFVAPSVLVDASGLGEVPLCLRYISTRFDMVKVQE